MKIAIVMNNGTIYHVEDGAGPAYNDADDNTDVVAAVFAAIESHDPIYVHSTTTPAGATGYATEVVYPVLANVSAVVELS